MKVKFSPPPNYEAICKVFKVKDQPVVFTYGDTLYAPNGTGEMSDHLMKHEETHAYQQKLMGVKAWWDKYLVDTQFRVSQEVEAYKAQKLVLKKNYNRALRRQILPRLVNDLAGPIYGRAISKQRARELIA